jgi:hypothetical protein
MRLGRTLGSSPDARVLPSCPFKMHADAAPLSRLFTSLLGVVGLVPEPVLAGL